MDVHYYFCLVIQSKGLTIFYLYSFIVYVIKSPLASDFSVNEFFFHVKPFFLVENKGMRERQKGKKSNILTE